MNTLTNPQDLNDSVIFHSDTFPYLTHSFLNQSDTDHHLIPSSACNTTTIPSWTLTMEALLFNFVLYLCLSLTSLVTALVASKTLLSYQKHLKLYLKQLRIHLEDWFLFFFTTTWLLSLTHPYGLCAMWRWTIALYIKLRYGQLGDIASGLDAAGSAEIPESRQIIKSLKVLRGKCNISELRERVEKTVSKRDEATGALIHPKFHQCLSTCGGFYCWKPGKFDMNHHVRFVEGMDEFSESLSESEVMDIVSKVSNEPFDKTRGFWEILVIPKIHYKFEEGRKYKEDKFAILVRISHGIGDGFSFLKLVMRDMVGADEEDYVVPSKPSRSNFLYKVGVFLYLFFKSPRAFYKEMGLKDKNPLHNEGIKLTGEKIHVWSDPIDIQWLKELKGELGCGMSTILLETLSGACRKYMTEKLGLQESQLPKHISTIIPVPAPNHPDNKLVNKFSIVMMPLELRAGNVLDRCRLIEKEAKVMSRSPDSYMNLFLMELVSVFPVSLARYFIINTQCTALISNLPGPKKLVNIWGYPLADTMFWLPNVGTSGISVSYLSYEKRLRFGLAVDTGAIPDGKPGAELLLNWMIEDLKSLAASMKLSSENMFIRDEQKEIEIRNQEESILNSDDELMDEMDKDKDEVSSEDYGYDDEASDISTDEDEVKMSNSSSNAELSDLISNSSQESQDEDDEELLSKDLTNRLEADQRLLSQSLTKYCDSSDKHSKEFHNCLNAGRS